MRKITPLLSCIFLCLTSGDVLAADSRGAFAVKGAGRLDCAQFVAAFDAKDDTYLVSGGWIEGYLTALNEVTPDTFDVASWMSTDLIATLLAQHCRSNAGDQLYLVMRAIVAQLMDQRLTEASPLLTLQGDRVQGTMLYIDTLVKLHDALKQGGYYQADVRAEFSASTVEALKAYQEAVGLPMTGLPDQLTLWRLFRPPASQQQ